jgi:hypothetical protein
VLDRLKDEAVLGDVTLIKVTLDAAELDVIASMIELRETMLARLEEELVEDGDTVGDNVVLDDEIPVDDDEEELDIEEEDDLLGSGSH